MKNILTVYKLNLPFLEKSKYDSAKCESIIEEIRRNLVYNELFISLETKKDTFFDVTILNFKHGFIRILKLNNLENYSLPSFQIDIFSDEILTKNFLDDFYSIFDTSGLDEYIIDLISDKINLTKYKLLTSDILLHDFNDYNNEKLETSLKNIDLNYLEYSLESNKKTRNNLYYIIYLNYILFRNILESKLGEEELEKILGTNLPQNFINELILTKKRLHHLQDINIEVFKKYRELLYHLFSLLKKTNLK